MTAHRFSFYVPGLCTGDATFDIAGDEHRHLRTVLRLTAGEAIQATNGRGLVVVATIERSEKTSTTAHVTAIVSEAEPATRLAIGLSLLPRPQMDAAVAQCVEVGITDLIPVLGETCHVRSWSPAASARVERVAIAAMKQSGRGWLPVVHEPVSVASLARRASEYAAVLVGDGDGPAVTTVPVSGNVLVVVGPEAGFSAAEQAALRAAGAHPVSVSDYRLRAGTAAVVLAAFVAHARGAGG